MRRKGGWFGESHRHYLARYGVKTARRYNVELTFTQSVMSAFERAKAEREARARALRDARMRGIITESALPSYSERPLELIERQKVYAGLPPRVQEVVGGKSPVEVKVEGLVEDALQYERKASTVLSEEEGWKLLDNVERKIGDVNMLLKGGGVEGVALGSLQKAKKSLDKTHEGLSMELRLGEERPAFGTITIRRRGEDRKILGGIPLRFDIHEENK